jgi:hypothetical protein
MDRDAFDDPVLGRVSPVEGHIYEWQYTVSIGGREAESLIEIVDEPLVLSESLLDRHRRFVTWLKGHEAKVRDFVVAQLYSDWRDYWYDVDKHPTLLTAEEFRAAIGLEYFFAYEDGGGYLYFNDGRLLGDHNIGVRVEADGSLVRPPELEG